MPGAAARRPDWLAFFEEGGDAFAEVVRGAQLGVDVDGGTHVAAEALDLLAVQEMLGGTHGAGAVGEKRCGESLIAASSSAFGQPSWSGRECAPRQRTWLTSLFSTPIVCAFLKSLRGAI
jgi:hypothetical protein